ERSLGYPDGTVTTLVAVSGRPLCAGSNGERVPGRPRCQIAVEGGGEGADEGTPLLGHGEAHAVEGDETVMVPQRNAAHLGGDGLGGLAETLYQLAHRHGEIAHQPLDHPAPHAIF